MVATLLWCESITVHTLKSKLELEFEVRTWTVAVVRNDERQPAGPTGEQASALSANKCRAYPEHKHPI